MENKNKIAVVILNWNGRPLLEKFLKKVVDYSTEADIFLVDNGSTDDSLIWVRSNLPMVKIIENKKNLGFAAGYNEALKKIDADIYVLLNSDVEVEQGWLAATDDVFSDANVGAAQPKIMFFYDRSRFEYAGAAGGFIDALGYPYCRGRIFNTTEFDRGQYDENIDIHWASGAALFIRATDFHNSGGFDEDFFAHQEEIDLCWRIRAQGKKIRSMTQSKVYHMGGATLNYMTSKKTFLNFRNSLFLLLKNKEKNLFITILMRLVLDGIAGIYFLLKGKPRMTIAIIKAHFSFYANFRKMYNKRERKFAKDKYRVKSIVWNYFVRGKRYFYQNNK